MPLGLAKPTAAPSRSVQHSHVLTLTDFSRVDFTTGDVLL